MAMDSKPVVAIITSPGTGHLAPQLGFAEELVRRHQEFSVFFLVPTTGPPQKAQKAMLESLPPAITYAFLPPVPLHDHERTLELVASISLSVTRSLPSIRQALEPLAEKKQLVALVLDAFATDAFDLAFEFRVPVYTHFVSSALCAAIFLHMPKLHEAARNDGPAEADPPLIKLPGCIPIPGFPESFRKSDNFRLVAQCAKRHCLADGIILNSFIELEPAAFKLLEKKELEPGNKGPIVYGLGPHIRLASNNEAQNDRSGCVKWLDDQPAGSVLFVCFGSGGTLSHEQLTELAFGLEMSEQKFLWVIRPPDDQSSAGYFGLDLEKDPLGFLPGGFLERTKGHGLTVPHWAPQVHVLSHKSTGGFLTHCGWNSIAEALVRGVPFIAWPLFAEQPFHAVQLTDDLKVALGVKADETSGLIRREEIARVVKDLMTGEEGVWIRQRMVRLKEAAEKAMSEDGSSTKLFSELVGKWKTRRNA